MKQFFERKLDGERSGRKVHEKGAECFVCECARTVLYRTGVEFFGAALSPSAAVNMPYQVAIIYSKEGENERKRWKAKREKEKGRRGGGGGGEVNRVSLMIRF